MATQAWNFKCKCHIDDFIGWPLKILWRLLSLMPLFFVYSGISLWVKRKYSRATSIKKSHLLKILSLFQLF
ncbi:PepSY domain-containing protein [Pseudocolwellia agarivorans]|uniref:PepSY domain-containing protein n=1 Tax=Pseudocolwellia agarivorans TaxID=1911682 RepID=UPI0009858FA8